MDPRARLIGRRSLSQQYGWHLWMLLRGGHSTYMLLFKATRHPPIFMKYTKSFKEAKVMAFGFFKRDMHISTKWNCDDTS